MSYSLVALEKNIEEWTGITIESLRKKSLEDIREEIESDGDWLRLKSYFPIIGRGNVLGQRVKTDELIEAENDEILK